jgi:CHAD domain-containing protein
MVSGYCRMKELKPALSGYIREAQVLLKGSAIPDEKAIHDVRVLMKKSRAVLKLAGPQLEKEWYERNIDALRETGRLLSGLRDTSVQRRILKELRKENPWLFKQLAENVNIVMMLRKADHPNINTEEITERIIKSETLLLKSGYRIRFEPMDKLDAKLLFRELEKTYEDVIALYLGCRSNPKPDKIHEFRKRAKDFLYQLGFFRPINRSAVKSVERRFETLAQSLGKYCDLKQLILDLEYKYIRSAQMTALDELIVIIKLRQDNYLARVWADANKIFHPGEQLVNLLGFKLLLI